MARAHERKQKRIMYGFGGGLRGMIVGTDWLTLLMCACASAFGILLVHSATLQNALSNEKPFSRDTLVMAIAVAAGLLSAVLVSAIDYDWLFKYWFVVAGGCLLLMFLLFTPLAVAPDARSDAKSWLPIPIPGFALNFQPSELLKMGFIITFTKHLDYVKKDINKLRNILLLGLHGMIPVALVVITGDLGSALVFVCLMAGMLFLTGLQLRYFAAVGVLGVVAAPLLWVTLSSFQKNRILAVYYPGYFTDADPTRT
ncbi:MAG: FtsW/RodA/SpoVE family cell cycle protein, partial [Oscillospiraceae bacterium]|nr:FtsW/RodA/SpoVE family cell cycle protein [Oscillospiraceae bacterium]